MITSINGYIANVSHNPDAAADTLVDHLIDLSRKTIDQIDRCVWAVSGGQSAMKIYHALNKKANLLNSIRENLIVVWVDERHVPHNNENSNFGVSYRYFWQNIEGVRLIAVPFCPNSQVSADEYARMLEEEGITIGSIDIALLGMGNDGHTASLFPYMDVLNNREELIACTNPLTSEYERITMTYPLINSSSDIFLYAYGPEKGSIFHRAVQAEDEEQYPILGIDKRKLIVYTDREFAG